MAWHEPSFTDILFIIPIPCEAGIIYWGGPSHQYMPDIDLSQQNCIESCPVEYLKLIVKKYMKNSASYLDLLIKTH